MCGIVDCSLKVQAMDPRQHVDAPLQASIDLERMEVEAHCVDELAEGC
jgi:hypothetical protein